MLMIPLRPSSSSLLLRSLTGHRWSYTTTSDAAAAASGYKSIGSFHNDNLAVLLQQSDDVYQIPPLPFSEDATNEQQTHSFRDEFLLDFDRWTFLNHGAFGAALRVGYDRAAAWRLHLERQPLRYFDRDLLPHLVYSARRLRDFMKLPSNTTTFPESGSPSSSIALLPNVTAGLNAVLAHHARTYRDAAHCVVWDTTYGSVKHMAQRYYGGPPNVSSIPFVALADSFDLLATSPTAAFSTALQSFLDSTQQVLQNKHVCFVLDHTTSNTALTLPIAALSQQIKDRYPDALVVVDGAHGLWAQEIPPLNTGIDVYVTNGHKWLSAPRGVGAMVVTDPQLAAELPPAIQSHAALDEPDLLTRFLWDGCRDYAAALAVPAVLEYWERHHRVPTLRQQCRATLRDGVDLLAREWHGVYHPEEWATSCRVTLTSELLSPMCLVRIPPACYPIPGSVATSTDAKQLQDVLHSLNIEVSIKCIRGELFVRLSAHAYNIVGDFDVLSKTCLQLWNRSPQ